MKITIFSYNPDEYGDREYEAREDGNNTNLTFDIKDWKHISDGITFGSLNHVGDHVLLFYNEDGDLIGEGGTWNCPTDLEKFLADYQFKKNNIKVRGSFGHVYIDATSGVVTLKEPQFHEEWVKSGFMEIERFDVAEYKAFWGEPDANDIDINLIGWIEKSGKYESPWEPRLCTLEAMAECDDFTADDKVRLATAQSIFKVSIPTPLPAQQRAINIMLDQLEVLTSNEFIYDESGDNLSFKAVWDTFPHIPSRLKARIARRTY